MKYDLKKIMLNAWKNYRRYSISFAEALHRAWLSAKAEEINAEDSKCILEGFAPLLFCPKFVQNCINDNKQ